ncbi:MAG TPA: YdeI/OmpD-associated family protein [Candidatus Saccharimonadales bacterium]|nr:YdeI/OmpD-associated family protein [Candidatus Saccharimonadales bacterium]
MKRGAKPVAKNFRATLERMQSRLGWTIIRIPFDVEKVWRTRVRLRVKGEINGFAFRTSLFPARGGGHILLVNKKMQEGGDVREGMSAQFHLEPDLEERIAIVPAELKRLFNQDPSLYKWFKQMNYSTRSEIGKWIGQVKSADARVRRAEQLAERLLAVMDAERELPPVLQLAFARDARARKGWNRMSPTQRRGQLLAIFYYRTPEARARRIEKTLEEASARAEGNSSRDETPE